MTTLTYSFPNLEPVHCSMFWWFSSCIQVSQETSKVVWYSHLLKNFPQCLVIHTVKVFKVVNEAEVSLGFPCFFYNPEDVGNLISGSSALSKSSLYIWKTWFMYCWSLGWRILSVTLLAYEMMAIVCWLKHSLALPFFETENWSFPVLWPPLSFPNLLAYWVQQFHSIIF